MTIFDLYVTCDVETFLLTSLPVPSCCRTECQTKVAHHLSNGETVIVVAAQGRVIGLLFAADTLRSAAAAAVIDLARRGLTVRVVSGDRREAVWAAATAAGVPREDTTWGATPGRVVLCV